MRSPVLGLLTAEGLPLATDYYELTSSRANFDKGYEQDIVESYFFRRIPQDFGSFILSVGLEPFIAYVIELQKHPTGVDESRYQWLMETCGGDLTPEFLDSLPDRFKQLNIWAVPEGTPMFPHEPNVIVEGNSIDVQILETYLLHKYNTQSPMATCASRIRYVGGKRSLVDFGARRGAAPMDQARATFIGGTDGTSFVEAAYQFDIPYIGTIPHKYIQERYDPELGFSESEYLAFKEYAEVYPHNFLPLVDTYNTVNGILNAIKVAREVCVPLGYSLRGIRLDSGDQVVLSKIARLMLSAGGFPDARIYSSGNLDEFKVQEMLVKGAQIDGMGVGTRFARTYLDGVYKLMSSNFIPSMKFTNTIGKRTLPDKQQVWRYYDEQGFMCEDIISLWDERMEGARPLLIPIMINGEIVYDFPTVRDIQSYTANELRKIKPGLRRLKQSIIYPVNKSMLLRELSKELSGRYDDEFTKVGTDWRDTAQLRMDGIMKAMEERLTDEVLKSW